MNNKPIKTQIHSRMEKMIMNKKFIIEIECDGNIDVEGMENLIEDMLNNQVNCTEMFFNVTETK